MITDKIKTLLANHIESTLIVQGYHWCVEGESFLQFHEFFRQIYADYYTQIDTLAEHIRAVSAGTDYPNGSVDIVSINKTIVADPIVGNKPIQMVGAILVLNNVLIAGFNELAKAADKEKLLGLSNYCADRLDKLNKLNWQLIVMTK